MKKWLIIVFALALFGCKKDQLSDDVLQPITSSTSYDLRDILFVDGRKGYAVGGHTFDESLILQTQDGGATWTQAHIIGNQKKIIYQLYPYKDKMYAVGLDGKTYIQYPEAENWHIHQNIWWEQMKDIVYFNDNEGLVVVGRNWNDGRIYKIDSLGNVLQRDSFNIEFNDIEIVKHQRTLISGYGTIWYSDDQGSTWNVSSAQGDHFVKLFHIGELVYALGYQGSFMVSKDNGANWDKLRNGSITYRNKVLCNDMLFVDEQKGIIVGNGGLVMGTKDGGKKWTIYKQKNGYQFNAITLIGPNKAIIVGNDGVMFKLDLNLFWG